MTVQQLSAQPTRVLRTTALACVCFALAAAIVGVFAGHVAMGVGIAVGLVLGAANGFAADWLFSRGVAFVVTSLFRLFVFTVVALGAALVLGFNRAWPVVLGIALAQLALAGSAAVESVRH